MFPSTGNNYGKHRSWQRQVCPHPKDWTRNPALREKVTARTDHINGFFADVTPAITEFPPNKLTVTENPTNQTAPNITARVVWSQTPFTPVTKI